MGKTTRRGFLGTTGSAWIVAVAGCVGVFDDSEIDSDGVDTGLADADSTPPTGNETRTGAGGSENGPPTVERTLPQEYERDELEDAALSGGPPPDGIPSINDPVFTAADDPPTNLDDGDPVFGVELNGEAKAYPQYVLVWHEIVNDVVGGESVAITYCPLTGTAQGFYRGDVEFGVSGRLINSNLVMFDRPTESRWPQMLASGLSGSHRGEFLEEFQVTWTTWERWRETHPDTVVLTEDTGFVRDYGGDPYGGYNPPSGYYSDENTLFAPLATDDRFEKKTVVLGVRNADGAMAVPKERVRERRIVDGTVRDVRYVTVYDPSLDTGYVYRNPDDQSVEYDDGLVTVDGEDFEPDSLPLEREIAFDAMWFAWYGYYPSTVVHE